MDMENTRTRRSSRRDAPLHRLLSSHHPDDHSLYHHEDGDGGRDTQTETSDDGSSVDDAEEKQSADDAAHVDETTRVEISGGVPYEHDVEAAKPELEKKKSSRSIKDPNLVSTRAWACCAVLMAVGDLGLPRRPCESEELVYQAQVGGDADCVGFHARVAGFVVDDLASVAVYQSRVWDHE